MPSNFAPNTTQTMKSLTACTIVMFVIGSFHALALSRCILHRAGNSWSGGCGLLFHQTPVMTLAPEPSITTGLWRADRHPASAWAGSMTDDGDTDALELEVYPDRSGLLRTEYGWFAIAHFVAAATLRFDLDVAKEIQPDALDVAIIQKAASILSSGRVWNRSDNRKCPPDATTLSIYCAMEKATLEVTGGFHHRRPALEAVRAIVDRRTQGRPYHHRLMDYNNDPSTRLSDVQSLFAETLAKIQHALQPTATPHSA